MIWVKLGNRSLTYTEEVSIFERKFFDRVLARMTMSHLEAKSKRMMFYQHGKCFYKKKMRSKQLNYRRWKLQEKLK
jgi:hypothetical protein